jgi:hypothetical protein|tara:strand:- start:1076 stop:1273 length:198 start_codon:yes stop_codon:yes gene_type:complete
MIIILGVPGVINIKIMICKKRIYSNGSIFEDSPKKPGAKDGKLGLSKNHNITVFWYCTKIIFKKY